MGYYGLTLRRVLFWLALLLFLIIFGVAFAQSYGVYGVETLSNSKENREMDSIAAPPLFIQKNAKQLARIARCESGNRQFNEKGEVIISRTKDYGRWQINYRWIPVAESMGYDIMTPEGNEAMAWYILSIQGFSAWACHNNH